MDSKALRPLISATELTDTGVCQAELVEIRVVRGLLDARELEVVRQLDQLAELDPSLFTQGVVAIACKTSLMHAERLRDHADTCTAIRELGEALADGATSGDRVDIVARASVGLNASERTALATHGQRLALAAGEQTATGFRKTVEHVVRQVRADDGRARLERQTRMARLKLFLDGDGMWCLHGRFDPASGARLEGRLRQAIEQQFANATPDTCPIDPLDKQQHLAALAFTALLLGDDTTSVSGLPDVTVIIDAETLLSGHAHEGTVCDIELGRFGLPVETIRRWACLGTVTPVVVAADIDNLIPICNRHHHLVHEGGWQLHLAPDRPLTVTQPGGNVSTNGPPTIRAA